MKTTVLALNYSTPATASRTASSHQGSAIYRETDLQASWQIVPGPVVSCSTAALAASGVLRRNREDMPWQGQPKVEHASMVINRCEASARMCGEPQPSSS